jgi:hypothetical protein
MKFILSFVAMIGMLVGVAAFDQSASQPLMMQVTPQTSVIGTVFISPSGSDSNACTFSSPCLTPQKATTALESKAAGQRVAVFRGGTYPLTSTWSLTNAAGDSGTAANGVMYAAFPGETPIISGGKQIPAMAVCTGGTCPNIPTLTCGGSCTAYFVSLPAASWSNFEALYYKGVRRFRSSNTGAPTVSTWSTQQGPVCVNSSSTNCPQQGLCGTGKFQCYDRFLKQAGDTTSSFHGCTASNAASPVNDVEWYLMEKWSASLMRCAATNNDTNACTSSSTQQCFTGRTQGAASSFGPISGHHYLRINAREDFSQVGQWLLDRCPTGSCASGTESNWTLYYLAAGGENPASDQIIVPQTTKLMNLTSIQYVTFQGLSFGYDNNVVAQAGFAATSHSSNIPAAISCSPCAHTTWQSNTFMHMMNWVQEFTGNSQSNLVQNNAFYDMGSGGTRVGLVPAAADTDSNVPQLNTIKNNVYQGGQRQFPGGTGSAVMIGNAHNNLVTKNNMFDWYNGIIDVGATQGYHGATGCPSCSLVHDNTISYNWLHDGGQGVESDEGCVYTANGSQTGNVFDHNLCTDMVQDLSAVGYNGEGIYLDQSSSFWTVTNNIVIRTSECSIDNNSPDNLQNGNVITNNIFAYGRQCAFKKSSTASGLVFTATKNIIYYDLGNSTNGPQWDSGGPQWLAGAFAFDQNIYFYTPGGLATNTHGFLTTDGSGNLTYYTFANWQMMVHVDQNSFVTNPLFVGPSFAQGDNYTFQAGSPFASIGFTPIDATLIGADLTLVPALPASVPASFPIITLNKNSGF